MIYKHLCNTLTTEANGLNSRWRSTFTAQFNREPVDLMADIAKAANIFFIDSKIITLPSILTDDYKNDSPFFIGEPFQTVWIETLDKSPITSINSRIEGEILKRKIYGILIHRLSSESYIFIMLAQYFDTSFSIEFCSYFKNDKSIPDIYHSLAFELFQSISEKHDRGIETVNEKLRIGVGDSRKSFKIKKIIHIRPHKSISQKEKDINKKINWSHQWEVMGHWRKVSGIGKDDLETYCVKGRTWVKPHKKGEGDFITKPRVLELGS